MVQSGVCELVDKMSANRRGKWMAFKRSLAVDKGTRPRKTAKWIQKQQTTKAQN